MGKRVGIVLPSVPMDRLTTLRQFVDRSPDDPFPRYALALELRNLGDVEGAIGAFIALLQQFPDYVPTYLMAGTTLTMRGRVDDARDVFRRGIDVARRLGDSHAATEIAGALAELD